MEPDQIERHIHFIIEQQAKFEFDIQKLQEAQAQTDQHIRTLVEVAFSLAGHLQETDRRLRETDERLNKFIRETDERISHGDKRLDALIDIVDKMIRRNGGGGPEKAS